WATIDARLTIAARTDAHPIVNSGWDIDRQGFRILDLAPAMTAGAGVRNFLAAAATSRAGLLHAEEALLDTNHSGAATSMASFSFRAGFSARPFAGLAIIPAWHADFRFKSESRLLQGNFQTILQVGTTIHLRTTATATAAKNFAEDIAESVS